MVLRVLPLDIFMRFKFKRRIFVLLVAFLCLFAVLVFLEQVEYTINVEQHESPVQLPVVSVVESYEQSAYLRVEAYCEVRPQWQLEIKAEVSGTVEYVSANAATGAKVLKGQELFKIDNTQYLADLADAKHILRQNQLELKRAQYKSYVAKQQFASVGKKPSNNLALHLPQIEIAKAAVKAAQARIAVAQRRLKLTIVKAPFTGVLIERRISPGQIIMAGEPVARLLGNEKYELIVNLSKSQWQQLVHPIVGQTVALLDNAGNSVGSATVSQAGGYIDTATRHYPVVLVTSKIKANILVGDYLQAVFTGHLVNSTLRIPETALTTDGRIWWLDAENRLQASIVKLLARDEQSIIIKTPKADQTRWKIVVTPLSFYLPGQKVTPQIKQEKQYASTRGKI